MTHVDPHGPYVVQLLLRALAPLDADRLAVSLYARAHDGLRFEFDDGSHASLALHPGLAHPDEVRAAASQTWDWPEAEAAAAEAQATLVVSLEAPAVERRRKLARMHAILLAASEQLDVAAIHWLPSQRLVDPAGWRDSIRHGASPADHALNVRLFKVPDGRPGEAILDTMGLRALGLRDLQVHFAGLDLQGLAMLLFSYAEYVFDHGDVLDDTALVRGLASHEEWECRVQRALAPPDREVTDIVPGDAAISR